MSASIGTSAAAASIFSRVRTPAEPSQLLGSGASPKAGSLEMLSQKLMRDPQPQRRFGPIPSVPGMRTSQAHVRVGSSTMVSSTGLRDRFWRAASDTLIAIGAPWFSR